MARSFLICDDMLYDREVQILTPAKFRVSFLAALNGERTSHSRFVKIERNLPFDPDWRQIRSVIFTRDNFTCQYCGERGGRLECDHILPRSRGGTDEYKNLTTACFSCNRAKGTKTINEWSR